MERRSASSLRVVEGFGARFIDSLWVLVSCLAPTQLTDVEHLDLVLEPLDDQRSEGDVSDMTPPELVRSRSPDHVPGGIA